MREVILGLVFTVIAAILVIVCVPILWLQARKWLDRRKERAKTYNELLLSGLP